jgi:hypothetical protein
MTTDKKVARRKLSLLELAADLGNVAKACRVMGYSRQQFYEIRRNFQTFGAEGLIDRLPGAKGPHPNRVAAEIEAAILDHALAHPCHGPMGVAQELALRGIQLRPVAGARVVPAPGDLGGRVRAVLAGQRREAGGGDRPLVQARRHDQAEAGRRARVRLILGDRAGRRRGIGGQEPPAGAEQPRPFAQGGEAVADEPRWDAGRGQHRAALTMFRVCSYAVFAGGSGSRALVVGHRL